MNIDDFINICEEIIRTTDDNDKKNSARELINIFSNKFENNDYNSVYLNSLKNKDIYSEIILYFKLLSKYLENANDKLIDTWFNNFYYFTKTNNLDVDSLNIIIKDILSKNNGERYASKIKNSDISKLPMPKIIEIELQSLIKEGKLSYKIIAYMIYKLYLKYNCTNSVLMNYLNENNLLIKDNILLDINNNKIIDEEDIDREIHLFLKEGLLKLDKNNSQYEYYRDKYIMMFLGMDKEQNKDLFKQGMVNF